jgi:hypothetical protein
MNSSCSTLCTIATRCERRCPITARQTRMSEATCGDVSRSQAIDCDATQQTAQRPMLDEPPRRRTCSEWNSVWRHVHVGTSSAASTSCWLAPCSLSSCSLFKMTSMTMKVPVRPTPALQCTQGTPGVCSSSCMQTCVFMKCNVQSDHPRQPYTKPYRRRLHVVH